MELFLQLIRLCLFMECLETYSIETSRLYSKGIDNPEYQAFYNLSKECKCKLRKIKPQKNRKKPPKTYKKLCWYYTELVSHLIPQIELRGFKSYHIDHIVPIQYGYKNGIDPQIIGSLENLRMIPYKDNLDKGTNLTEESLILIEKWSQTE